MPKSSAEALPPMQRSKLSPPPDSADSDSEPLDTIDDRCGAEEHADMDAAVYRQVGVWDDSIGERYRTLLSSHVLRAVRDECAEKGFYSRKTSELKENTKLLELIWECWKDGSGFRRVRICGMSLRLHCLALSPDTDNE